MRKWKAQEQLEFAVSCIRRNAWGTARHYAHCRRIGPRYGGGAENVRSEINGLLVALYFIEGGWQYDVDALLFMYCWQLGEADPFARREAA